MNEVNLHGEVAIKRVKGIIPKEARKVSPKNGQYKIADSETTGNFHLLEATDTLEVYEKDGILYAKNQDISKITCVDKTRHDTQILEPTKSDEILVIEPVKEFDYLTMEKRNVAD